jgi:hypothetical protein
MMELIGNIEWDKRNGKISPTKFRLVKEYLRRLALWTERLDSREFWPFGNLPIVVDETVELSSMTKDEIGRLPISTREKIMLENIFAWKSIDKRVISAFELPDPYAPILEFFSEGGCLRSENRLLLFDDASIPIGRIEDYLKMSELV